MDKLSTKVLRYLKKQSEPVTKEALVAKFGPKAAESIRFLEKAEYIKSGSAFFRTGIAVEIAPFTFQTENMKLPAPVLIICNPSLEETSIVG